MASDDHRDDRAHTAPTLPAMPIARLASRRILLVEDEVSLGNVIASVLDRHEVLRANDGADALRVIDGAGPIDLVLSDVHMPWMNGIDLHRALAARRAPLAGSFVLMTGAPLSDAHRLYIERAGLTVLAKPFSIDEIERTLAALPSATHLPEQVGERRKIG